MAIQKIDGITIDGGNKAFGGYIYSFDLQVGVGPDISKIVIDFISEDGTYSTPILSTKQSYAIGVGNIFTDDFYAIKWENKKTRSGKILSVTFFDSSILLDNLWVGLNWKMGNKNQNPPSNLILVGQQFHPCDVNEDGVYDNFDLAELVYDEFDPCELRCPADTNLVKPIIDSCNLKTATEIFAVKYNFKMLLTEIANKRITVNPPVNTNDFYWATHTGTLREVLSQWCAEFGWTFFWEKGTLNFLDVSKPPKINMPTFANIDSVNSMQTLEGTFSRGCISHFAEPGILQKQDCSQPQPVLLTCLTLQDLFGSVYNPQSKALIFTQDTEGSPDSSGNVALPSASPKDGNSYLEYQDDIFKNGVEIHKFEESVVCAYYGEKIRNLYNFYNYYGINNDTIANTLLNKQMDRIGNLKIVKVLSSAINTSLFNKLVQDTLDDGTQVMSQDDSQLFLKNKGYFVLGYFDEEHLKKVFNVEHTLATEFFGQHYIRAMRTPTFGKNPQIIPGGGTYYSSLATDARDLPFTAFRPTSTSKVAKLVQTFAQKQANKFKTYGTKLSDKGRWEGEDGPRKLLKSIVYFHKNPIWSPTNELLDYFAPIYKQKVPLLPKVLNVDPNLLVRFLNAADGTPLVKAEDLVNIKLIAFYPVNFSFTTTITENPDEEFPHYIEDVAPFALSAYGLLSKTCVACDIDDIRIFTPGGASVQFEISPEFNWELREVDPTVAATSPHYQVYLAPTIQGRGFVPKTESVYISPAPDINSQGSVASSGRGIFSGQISPSSTSSQGVLKTEYNVQDINRSIIKFINSLQSPSCIIPDNLLLAAHQEFNVNLNFSILSPFVSQEFELYGVTLQSGFKISDGLEALKVRIDENGVKTNITIGNTKFTPPSPEFLQRKVEFELRSDVRYGRPNPW